MAIVPWCIFFQIRPHFDDCDSSSLQTTGVITYQKNVLMAHGVFSEPLENI